MVDILFVTMGTGVYLKKFIRKIHCIHWKGKIYYCINLKKSYLPARSYYIP